MYDIKFRIKKNASPYDAGSVIPYKASSRFRINPNAGPYDTNALVRVHEQDRKVSELEKKLF